MKMTKKTNNPMINLQKIRINNIHKTIIIKRTVHTSSKLTYMRAIHPLTTPNKSELAKHLINPVPIIGHKNMGPIIQPIIPNKPNARIEAAYIDKKNEMIRTTLKALDKEKNKESLLEIMNNNNYGKFFRFNLDFVAEPQNGCDLVTRGMLFKEMYKIKMVGMESLKEAYFSRNMSHLEKVGILTNAKINGRSVEIKKGLGNTITELAILERYVEQWGDYMTRVTLTADSMRSPSSYTGQAYPDIVHTLGCERGKTISRMHDIKSGEGRGNPYNTLSYSTNYEDYQFSMGTNDYVLTGSMNRRISELKKLDPNIIFSDSRDVREYNHRLKKLEDLNKDREMIYHNLSEMQIILFEIQAMSEFPFSISIHTVDYYIPQPYTDLEYRAQRALKQYITPHIFADPVAFNLYLDKTREFLENNECYDEDTWRLLWILRKINHLEQFHSKIIQY